MSMALDVTNYRAVLYQRYSLTRTFFFFFSPPRSKGSSNSMRGFDRASKELALLRAAVQGGGDGDVSVEGGGPKCRLFRIVMFKNKKNYPQLRATCMARCLGCAPKPSVERRGAQMSRGGAAGNTAGYPSSGGVSSSRRRYGRPVARGTSKKEATHKQ